MKASEQIKIAIGVNSKIRYFVTKANVELNNLNSSIIENYEFNPELDILIIFEGDGLITGLPRYIRDILIEGNDIDKAVDEFMKWMKK